MMQGSYELVSALGNAKDWRTYHDIRRQELFVAKGRGDMYDPDRPEERTPNHYPFLLKYRGKGVGTVRLDIRADSTAVIRLVAVPKAEQGKGHGRQLATMIEEIVRTDCVSKILVNAAPEAVGYYEKLGFVREDWDPSELCGISADSIQMSKEIPHKFSHWGFSPGFAGRVAEANAIYGDPRPIPKE